MFIYVGSYMRGVYAYVIVQCSLLCVVYIPVCAFVY